MSDLQDKQTSKNYNCFCIFLKKELEDTFSSNADALNFNNHINKHQNPMYINPSYINRKSSYDYGQTNIKDINDVFYGE